MIIICSSGTVPRWMILWRTFPRRTFPWNFPDGHFLDEQFPEGQFPKWTIPRMDISGWTVLWITFSWMEFFPIGHFPDSHFFNKLYLYWPLVNKIVVANEFQQNNIYNNASNKLNIVLKTIYLQINIYSQYFPDF